MIDRSYRLDPFARAVMRNKKQQEAIDQINAIWKTEKSAILIRPTGFGKTYTVATLLNVADPVNTSFKLYKKVLFVYPLDAVADALRQDIYTINVKNKKLGQPLIDDSKDKIMFMTYQMLAKHQGDDQKLYDAKFKDLDLIIFDEFHCAGAVKTVVGCKKLFTAAVKAKVLGMTATYVRNDGIDQALEIFEAHNMAPVYTYTDAVDDGIMPKLAYYDAHWYKLLDSKGRWIVDTQDIKNSKEQAIKRIKQEDIEDNTVCNFGDIIKDAVIDTLGENELNKGQRWLCLFSKIEAIDNKKQEILVSFEKAFPNKKIKLLEIHTRDAVSKENLKKLVQEHDKNGNKIYNEWLEPKDDECVVILAVSMLNMGYHAGILTGEILYRATSSNIIYQQQIGRTIDAMRDTEPIIIDLANAIDKLKISTSIHITSSKTNKDDLLEETNDDKNTISADMVTSKCLIVRTLGREYKDVANKLEEFRYSDTISLLLDGIFSKRITTSSQVNSFALMHHTLPRYMFAIIKKMLLANELTIKKTVINTIGGVATVSKVESKEQITDAKRKEIELMFRGLV